MKNNFLAMVLAVTLCLTACAACPEVRAQEAAPKVGTTLENLMTAYSRESNSHLTYLAFAQRADEEGYDIAASLFRAVAESQMSHINRFAGIIKDLGGTPDAALEIPVVNGTKANLEAAYENETYESRKLYPAFAKRASKDNIADAAKAFETAAAAEAVHTTLYANMLKNLTFSEGLTKDFYVCPVCGNIVDAITRSLCPICSATTKKFKKVN